MVIHEELQDTKAVAVSALLFLLVCPVYHGLLPSLCCLYLEWWVMLFVSLILPLHWSSKYPRLAAHRKQCETSEHEAHLASVLC